LAGKTAAPTVGNPRLNGAGPRPAAFPLLRVDFASTQRLAELAQSIFGDLLPARIKTGWWWTHGLTRTLVDLRGLEQMLYDMTDNPQLMHRLMALFSQGTMACWTPCKPPACFFSTAMAPTSVRAAWAGRTSCPPRASVARCARRICGRWVKARNRSASRRVCSPS